MLEHPLRLCCEFITAKPNMSYHYNPRAHLDIYRILVLQSGPLSYTGKFITLASLRGYKQERALQRNDHFQHKLVGGAGSQKFVHIVFYLYLSTYPLTSILLDSPAPTINSTLCPEGYACPGERIDFTCVTLDSNHHTWTSDNYTSDELHIWHTLPISQRRNSTRFPNTSAVLVSVSEMNGRLQLTSRLTITISESATNQIHSVTCSHMMDASSFSFQIVTGKSNDRNIIVWFTMRKRS